jgi:hypothetical protein
MTPLSTKLSVRNPEPEPPVTTNSLSNSEVLRAVEACPAPSLKVQVAIIEGVIPKLMDVAARPPCGKVQALVLAKDVPITSVDDPHGLKMFTVAVLIRSAYDGETIARLRSAIVRNRRMALLRS